MTNETERRWNSDGKVTNNTGFAVYENALRAVAKERNVPLLDVEAFPTDLFNIVGRQKMDTLSKTKADGSIDVIHVNATGGMFIGVFIADNAKRLVPELAPYIQ
ncbi:pectinesterase [Granulicella rosea]|uniref:Pectinesterase n=1 Tax=Granulicella rosea TaxID=474952 RepID=A0A239EDS3_9BACT|nr:hypothetical protein [Granulicella rosea]SNS42042.1 pectinesterase [Granulicella rosea]